MAQKDYRIGPLRLSVQQQIVFKDHLPIPMAPIPFRILLVLVENPGEIVSREVLRERIWPDSYVEEAGLSKNISVLRSTLRPYLEEEEFIRTWSKRGYQLLLPVTEIAPASDALPVEARPANNPDATVNLHEVKMLQPDALLPLTASAGAASARAGWPHAKLFPAALLHEGRSTSSIRLFGVVLSALLVILLFLAADRWRSPHPISTGSWNAVPLTPGRDLEFEPATTTDGKQLAYVSRATGSRRFQIFQHAFAASAAPGRALETGPGDAFYPTWSPDAKRIAFLRCGAGPCEIATIPAEGGPVSVARVLPLYIVPDDQAYYQFRQVGPAWTADGRSLIYPYQAPGDDAERLVQQELITGAVRQLTSGQPGDDDGAPATSHDGKSVAFLRRQLNHTDIMVLNLASGVARVLETEPTHTPSGVTWAHDDSGVVVGIVRRPSAPSLLWVPLHGEPSILPVNLPGMLNPMFTGDGKALMVLSANRNRNLAEVSGDSHQPELVFRTKQKNSFSALSPDTRQLAFLSDLSGRFEVWLANRQGSALLKPLQLTHNLPYYPVSIAWSPDGRTLAIGISHTNQVEMVDVATGSFRTLELPGLEKSNVWSPAWALDGRSIYLAVHGARNGIVHASTTTIPGVQEVMSGDAQELRLDAGQALYFTSGNTCGVYKLPLVPGSSPQLVPALAGINPARDWFIDRGKLFYLDLHDESRRLRSYNLATGEAAIVTAPLTRPAFLDGSLTYAAKEHLLLYSEWTEDAGSQIFLLYPPETSVDD